jgi:hypothetical protein
MMRAQPFRSQDTTMADIGVSAFYFLATTAAAAVSGTTYAPDAGQPAWFGRVATVEKLYQREGKPVDTPMLDIAQAEKTCPNGYVVYDERRVERPGETWLAWRIICQAKR